MLGAAYWLSAERGVAETTSLNLKCIASVSPSPRVSQRINLTAKSTHLGSALRSPRFSAGSCPSPSVNPRRTVRRTADANFLGGFEALCFGRYARRVTVILTETLTTPCVPLQLSFHTAPSAHSPRCRPARLGPVDARLFCAAGVACALIRLLSVRYREQSIVRSPAEESGRGMKA